MANELKMVPVELLERIVKLDNNFADHRQAQHDLVKFLHSAAPVPPAGDVEVVVYACGPANQRRYIEPGNAFLGWHIHDAKPLVDGAHIARLAADVDRWHDICVERTAERDGLLAEVERMLQTAAMYQKLYSESQSELAKARELIALQSKVIEFATIIDKQAFAKGTQNIGVTAFRAMGDALSDLARQSAPAAKDGESGETLCLLCFDKKTVPGPKHGDFVRDCPECCGEEG